MNLRVFKNKVFTRFAKKSGIKDEVLCTAIENAERGIVDADLGGGVIKQRIARKGSGKSGGFRTIILFKSGDKAFFVHGFAKNAQDNISKEELQAFKKLAEKILEYDNDEIKFALKYEQIIEVKYEKKEL